MGEEPVSKSFLAVGDHLINPELLAYAVLENDKPEPRLRLGFAAQIPGEGNEISLQGEDAIELLRWLRLNAAFLTKAGGFGSVGGLKPQWPPIEGPSRSTARPVRSSIGQGWAEIHSPKSVLVQ